MRRTFQAGEIAAHLAVNFWAPIWRAKLSVRGVPVEDRPRMDHFSQYSTFDTYLMTLSDAKLRKCW